MIIVQVNEKAKQESLPQSYFWKVAADAATRHSKILEDLVAAQTKPRLFQRDLSG
jgi:hypothetical protein